MAIMIAHCNNCMNQCWNYFDKQYICDKTKKREITICHDYKKRGFGMTRLVNREWRYPPAAIP